jgi:hypothetical protein
MLFLHKVMLSLPMAALRAVPTMRAIQAKAVQTRMTSAP